ncbi:MAG TPA: LD-carboxypeptidase [Puia sp.]|nr:LD-carboxypeptidase [Puia sp.]
MVTIPPYLQPGDTIGIACPAGFMSLEKAQSCIEAFKAWGYHLKVGRTMGGDSTNYFSGDDKTRLDDLQKMLDDDEVKAVFCARGGYGIGRIIDKIDFSIFRKKPKWIIGFSDVTILHSHIYSNFNIASLHAPMASAFNDGESANEFVQSLRNAIEGKKIRFESVPHEFNRRGEAIGELVGGNLTLLAHLVGTPSELKTRGRILVLEDTGEYLYNIDRMLYQLLRNKKLQKLGGLILGGFDRLKDTERPFGSSAYEIIRDLVQDFDYPVCFDFPVGHMRENFALKIGIGYKLKVGKNKIVLEE